MKEEAFQTAKGVYNVCKSSGFSFQTPEAYYINGIYRCVIQILPYENACQTYRVEHLLAFLEKNNSG